VSAGWGSRPLLHAVPGVSRVMGQPSDTLQELQRGRGFCRVGGSVWEGDGGTWAAVGSRAGDFGLARCTVSLSIYSNNFLNCLEFE
jgi:hypothetical protein